MSPLPSPHRPCLDRYCAPEQLSREAVWKPRHNTRVATRRRDAIYASIPRLHAATRRYVAPRDYRFSLDGFSNLRIQTTQVAAPTALPKTMDANRLARMILPPPAVP